MYSECFSKAQENGMYQDRFPFLAMIPEVVRVMEKTEKKYAKACKRHKARIHMYPINHTPSWSKNRCRSISDSPKAFRARILIRLNTLDFWIRCKCTKLTGRVAQPARTRETPDFLGRPASQTSEVQDGSRQPVTNFKNLDRKLSISYRQKHMQEPRPTIDVISFKPVSDYRLRLRLDWILTNQSKVR